MKRPRSRTASVAMSMMRLAAVSASAAGSANTVRVASEAMIRSYPLVQPALAFERFTVANVMCPLGYECLSCGLTRRGQVRQNPERLQCEHGSAPTGRLGLHRPGDRMSDHVGNDLGPGPRVPQRRTRSDDRVAACRAGRQQAIHGGEPKRHRLQGGADDLDTVRIQTQA